MNNFFDEICKGKRPNLDEFILVFSDVLNLLSKLKDTIQDPEWHAEGNVFIHTQCVLDKVYKFLDQEANHLSLHHKLALILAAVFHDIGKPLVTKSKEIDGLLRIVAPHHEERGCSYLAYKLLEFNIPYDVVQQTLRLVAYHHQPRRLVLHNASKKEYFKLARLVNTELLFYLAKADILGRCCKDQQSQCDYIDLFRLFCEESSLWGNEDPYKAWKQFFTSTLTHLSPASRDAVLGYAVQDFEQGTIFTPEEAVARCYPYLQSFPQLIIMSGPSGSGKSTWIQDHLETYKKISLDDLREEFGKNRSNQENNNFIVTKAKEKLKGYLRNREKIVWDATNLRKDFRSMISQLGYDYHALVTLVVSHIPESAIYQGNQTRTHQVSKEVVSHQMQSLEWPNDHEVHRIAFINQKDFLDIRGTCHPNVLSID